MGMDLMGIGSVADFAKGIIDRIWPTASPEEKLRAQTEIQRQIQERENVIVQAKEAVMTAELSQEDAYTKRGRPTIIYAGLLFIALVHVVFPIVAWVWQMGRGAAVVMPALALPTEFWMAWGGCCSIYILGRSSEKNGGEVGGILGKVYDVIGGRKQ